jgi:hypothetical protein
MANGRQSRAIPKTPLDLRQPSGQRPSELRDGVHVGSWKVHVTPIEPSGSCRRCARET